MGGGGEVETQPASIVEVGMGADPMKSLGWGC